MSTSVSWNGSSYTVPATGEEDWGGSSKVDGLLVSLAQNALSKAGGTFALTAEVDFSSTAGLKSLYYKSRGTNVSTTGILRLANLEGVGWRNAANSADLLLTVSGSDRLQFDSVNVPTISSTDTLTNKTLTAPTITAAVIDVVDNSFSIKDNSDATKIAKFQCSGITTGTTRTYTLPDVDDSLVTLTATQTLTNKTLDGVTVTTAIAGSGIAQFEDGASGFRIVKAGDPTKGLIFDLSGTTALKKTTIAPTSSLDRTITLPNATTTLVGTDTTDTLTNKTITSPTINTPTIDVESLTEQSSTPSSPSSGTRKFYVKQDGNAYLLDSSGNETAIGSGSSSGVNYITNGLFETAVTGWSTYADAAGTSPVDGTGGSPTTTFTRSTSSPLRSAASGLLTKDAANRQGEGVAYAFTIASADQAKVLNVSFEYAVSSSFASGDSSDVRIWIYDVTNSTLIPVTPYTIQGGSTGSWKFSGIFQTASNSTSYRLIFHVATTNASAWTMKVDSVVVGPQIQLMGPPVGDWTSYTPTLSAGFGTVTSNAAYYRRVGDSLEIMATWVNGTVAASIASISLPSGIVLDTAKLSKSSNTTSQAGNVVGHWAGGDTSSTGVILTAPGTSTTLLYFGPKQGNSNNTIPANGSAIANNTDSYSMRALIPVSGWSSTVVMSNDTDTRVVAAQYTGNGGTVLTANTTNIDFSTSVYDTHSSWSGTVWTAPVSGIYKIFGVWLSTANVSADTVLYVDGSASRRLFSDYASATNHQFYGSVKLTAGQTISIRSDAGATLSNSATQHHISIERLSGPSVIAASEKVYLQYTSNAGTSLTANTTNIDYSTKVNDSHGAWSGTVFTAPRAGLYTIIGNVSFSSSASRGFGLYVNSSQVLTSRGMASGTDNSVSFVRYLNAGDTCSIRCEQTGTLSNSSVTHWISIYSQG